MSAGKEKIIVALDVDTADAAAQLVSSLKDQVGAFKIGLELFNAVGPDIFARVKAEGAGRIFYDCKFHDIPNTVAGAVKASVKYGLWLMNVHAMGGLAMMEAAREAAETASVASGVERPLLLGVTILTSISQDMLTNELRVAGDVSEQVVHLAKLSVSAGMDGVVASPHEIELIRAVVPSDFLIVTPGVRPAGADILDQKRVMTPQGAVKMGASYLVVGRPITKAENPVAAAYEVAREIETV